MRFARPALFFVISRSGVRIPAPALGLRKIEVSGCARSVQIVSSSPFHTPRLTHLHGAPPHTSAGRRTPAWSAMIQHQGQGPSHSTAQGQGSRGRLDTLVRIVHRSFLTHPAPLIPEHHRPVSARAPACFPCPYPPCDVQAAPC